jgi:hypothetical protein
MIRVLLITLRNWVDRSDRDLPLVIVNELDGTAYLCWARRGEDITTYGGLQNVREGSGFPKEDRYYPTACHGL